MFYSLNHLSPNVNFRDATINGLAPDKGLYFPGTIPQISSELLDAIEHLSEPEIAFQVIAPYIGDTIPATILKEIIEQTISFPFPLVRLSDNIYTIELFHGPTMAFKDVGARFMARCLGYFLKEEKQKVTVLVATSGDTGGAVADGFYGVDGIDVVILYPEGKVSAIQELQLTTHGNNIRAIAVDGTFDDCQKMVKEAFNDEDLKQLHFLTSANSINVARWLPQQFYYFYAWKYWEDKKNPPVISVPSGNFGNICAGILAKASGLPLNHFIAACNANDVFSGYLDTGKYVPRTSESTISNAMDVGDPSNLKRVIELCGNDLNRLKEYIHPYSCDNKQTRDAIRQLYTQYHYLADPHGAVGFAALQEYLVAHPDEKGIFLETAHPLKFSDVIESVIGEKIPIPAEIEKLSQKEKVVTRMGTSFAELKNYIR